MGNNNDKINIYSDDVLFDKEDNKFFLKLKKEYLIVKNIKDYKERQSILYVNKNKRDIIEFEIARIKNSEKCSSKIKKQLLEITDLLSLIGDNLTDELYTKIINLIIKLELSLDMKIGLFDELCKMYNDELENRAKENITFGDTLKYKK